MSGQAAGGRAGEEAGWIEQARRGDPEAFRRLVERHQDRIYGLAYRVIGSAPEAEEAAQDAFVRAWRALPGFRGEAELPERLLARLSEVQRAVVTTYYVEGRSVDEVARLLDLPANTVKTHLHRARAVLRAALQREGSRAAEAGR